MILAYILQNWALILITVAFLISLKVTGHQDKWSGKRMYFLVGGVFILSIVVFAEFYLADKGGFLTVRTVLMAVRYSEHFFKLLFNVSLSLKRWKELSLLHLTHKSRTVSLVYSETPSEGC